MTDAPATAEANAAPLTLPLASLSLGRAVAIALASLAVTYGAAFALHFVASAIGVPFGLARYAVEDFATRVAGVAALVLLLRAAGGARISETRLYPLKPVDFGYAIVAIFLCGAGNGLVHAVEARFGVDEHWWGAAMYARAAFGWPIVLFAFTGAIVSPVAEELLSRAVLLGPIASRFGTGPGLVVSSGIFAALHLSYALFPSHFIAGLVFGSLVVRTKRLATGYFAHAAYNGLIFAYDLGRLAHSPH